MAKRYQRGNQNPYIEEEQTTQWPKEKVQTDRFQISILKKDEAIIFSVIFFDNQIHVCTKNCIEL